MDETLGNRDVDQLLLMRRREQPGNIVCIEVAGELDMSTAPQLQSYLVAETATDPRHLILDLSEVRFIASHGVAVLVAAHQNHADVHGQLHLVGVTGNPAVEQVLVVTGLHEVLRIYSDLGELVALLNAS